MFIFYTPRRALTRGLLFSRYSLRMGSIQPAFLTWAVVLTLASTLLDYLFPFTALDGQRGRVLVVSWASPYRPGSGPLT